MTTVAVPLVLDHRWWLLGSKKVSTPGAKAARDIAAMKIEVGLSGLECP